MATEYRQIQVRRDTATNWATLNPILNIGEFGYTTDSPAVRIGDGLTKFLDLPIVGMFDPDTGLPTNGLSSSPVQITVEHKTAAAGYPYAVIRAHTGGRFVPGLVDKRYGGDFDVTNPTSTGTAFIPPGERLDSFARRTGYPVVTNASGWNVVSNFGEMRGVQIRNGKVFHDFERADLNGSPAGIEGIGVLPNGRIKCYSALRGDTAASMIAEGVVHAWSYGPNLVVNGAAQDLTAKNWQYFLTEISGRTIIGQSSTGDVIVIATVGKTNSAGLTGNAMVALAVAEGCFNASVFDGGGSTQAYVQGYYTIPSSDDATGYDGTVGRRKVGDCFMIAGNIGTAAVDTGWRTIPLRSGFQALDSSQVPMIRQLDGMVEFRGAVRPTGSGSPTFPTTDVTVGDLPPQFRTSQNVKSYRAPGNGGNSRKVTVSADFSIGVVGDSSTPTYVTLDPVKYGIDTIL